MSSMRKMGRWLNACVITTLVVLSGCATVEAPDVSREFREYEPPARGEREELVLPVEPKVQFDEDGTVWLTKAQFQEFRDFVETAHTIDEVAQARVDELQAREEEIRYLVRAGRITERRAELIAQMYTNEVQECRWIRVGAYGVAGLSFIFLGAAAL